MISDLARKNLEKQGYKFTGKHSSTKICHWTKSSLSGKKFCYKHKFYNIQSHQCAQMTTNMFCSNLCDFCWRDIPTSNNIKMDSIDDPKDIIENTIKEQLKTITGLGGHPNVNKKRLEESKKIKHFAISLTGEPTMYPKLGELIKKLHEKKITSFLVTNGTSPSMVKKLVKEQPTQLYITLPAPDEETYVRVCSPLLKNQWKKIIKSLKLLKNFKRGTIRLTLAKDVNMVKPERYAELIKLAKPKFVECKAYMWVGYSRERLKIENMPLHKDIKDFAKKLSKFSGYIIVDEKINSRVVLLAKNDVKDRIMKF